MTMEINIYTSEDHRCSRKMTNTTTRTTATTLGLLLRTITLITISKNAFVMANPTSKPFVPFRTSPLDQTVHHEISIPDDNRKSIPNKFTSNSHTDQNTKHHMMNDQCPLSFTLGLSQRSHHAPDTKSMAMIEPPSIYPVHPSYGSGRQVIHTTQFEHLDLLTPAEGSGGNVDREGLMQHEDFPLLFESSSFLGAPLVHDTNGDGIPDAVLVDYDGGLYFMGLHNGNTDSRRYFHQAQIPRLYVRRDWMTTRLNETIVKDAGETANAEVSSQGDDHIASSTMDPYHSYFEYGSRGSDEASNKILRGVPANILQQHHEDVVELEKRRKRKVKHEKDDHEHEEKNEGHEEHHEEFEDERGDGSEDVFEDGHHEGASATRRRRLLEVQDGQEEHNEHQHANDNDGPDEDTEHGDDDYQQPLDENIMAGERESWPDDDDYHEGGDQEPQEGEGKEEKEKYEDKDDFIGEGDDHHDGYGQYDDYYASRYGREQNDYYDDKHYIRIPPHVLSTPVLADLKKAYGDTGEREEFIFIAVSYYFDEDEYEGQFSYKRFENTDKGDETETSRGKYVASAIVTYILDSGSPRFGREEHLDLSGDITAPHDLEMMPEKHLSLEYTKMGAFALASPTIADIDGNGEEDVLMGTSMGMVYCLHARHMYAVDGWPIQLPNPIESRIMVEDVLGNTNLEIFVLDAAANVYCLDTSGQVLWRRNLLGSIESDADLRGLSPMTMGDVNGDGILDIVLTLKVMSKSHQWKTFVVVISATTGEDVVHFPMEFDTSLLIDDGTSAFKNLQKLPQALLIDLHANQDHWKAYMNRNGTSWNPTKEKTSESPPHGGNEQGLHIVQPIGTNLFIIEGGSGCTQMIAIGEEMYAMVQADDVHGTNNIDLVISTKAGNIVTLESPAVPYHPLNVWNSGEVRSRRNNFAQGFTASQGIFVHDVSRQYRDIFGVYVPITFEIFDNRPNIQNEADKRVYNVEVRDGTSAKRAILRRTYNEVGVYTERLYISYGPGYYTLTVLLRTSHGLIYEDSFHIGYNVHYMDGFGLLLWLPLCISTIFIISCSKKKAHWDDDEYDETARGKNQGILGTQE